MDGLVRLPAPMVDALLGWFAETTLIVAALTAAALAGDRWRRPRLGPAARHALWLVILVKLITPPVIQWPWSRPWMTAKPEAAPIVAVSVSEEAAPEEESEESAPAAIVPVGLVPPEPQPCAPEEEIGAGDSSPVVAEPPAPEEAPPAPSVDLAQAGVGLWLIGSVVVASSQGWRIARFGRRVRSARFAPDWLIAEAEEVAEGLGTRLPRIGVVDGLASPILWCLGRPILLVPEGLTKTLGAPAWRCVLAHELAHLRRGDQWVSRLEVLAGLIWWWNPLFWWARHRIDAEAELACDAWVVATLPEDRFTYAESLVRICTAMSPKRAPAPSVGVAGSGRFFERRLTMILKDRVANRLSSPAVLAAILLLVLALPSWTSARPAPAAADDPQYAAALDDPAAAVADEDDQDDAVADDDDQDDDKASDAQKKEKAEARQAERAAAREKARVEREKARVEREKARIEREKARRDARRHEEAAEDHKLSAEDQKKLAEMQEKIAKEMEEKFGPGSEFQKQMEKLGKEMEKKFGPGSEFEKQMQGLGKEMEKQFGPGSDFEKKMEKFGKEMEEKFGPGSDFEKKMAEMGERIGKEMEGKFGPGSEFQKKMEKLSKKKAEKDGDEAVTAKPRPRANKARTGSREARVKAIEAQIKALSRELERIKKEAADEQDKDDDTDADA